MIKKDAKRHLIGVSQSFWQLINNHGIKKQCQKVFSRFAFGDKHHQRKDKEFLPGALEILETPASPVRVAFVWFICVLVIVALLWGWFGQFDIVATAQGKIQPKGRVKIIESLENGKTKSVTVYNGMKVEIGDILVALDDTEIRADEKANLGKLYNLQAEIVRRESLLDHLMRWKKSLVGPDRIASLQALFTIPKLELPASFSPTIYRREQQVLEADWQSISASFYEFSRQQIQRQVEIAGLDEVIAAQKLLILTLEERVAMRSKLVQSHAGSRAQLIDAIQSLQEAISILTDKSAQKKLAQAALDVVTAEEMKLLENVVSDNTNRKLEAERELDKVEQEVIKIQKQRERMTIRAPITGIVQFSSITTAGQVILSGTELMRIVSDDAPLEIEAYLPNKDVGFVRAGQPVIIKVEAYPFTRFGILEGHVISVARDAIAEPDAQSLESTQIQQIKSTLPTGNVPRVQNLVFSVIIGLDKTHFQVDGNLMPLTSGMGVTVEIKTGKRRILEYLFSPLAQIGSESMGER